MNDVVDNSGKVDDRGAVGRGDLSEYIEEICSEIDGVV